MLAINPRSFFICSPLPYWWRRCALSAFIIPQNCGESKGRRGDSRIARQDWMVWKTWLGARTWSRRDTAKPSFWFRLCYRSLQVLHYNPCQTQRECFRTPFVFVILLQNRSILQAFSKSIHTFQSADRLIPWRWWEQKVIRGLSGFRAMFANEAM